MSLRCDELVRASKAITPGGQCFLKPGLTLQECGFVVTALREKRSKNECAERDGKDARLGTQNAMLDRDSGIAEIADTNVVIQTNVNAMMKAAAAAKMGRQRAEIHNSSGNSAAMGTTIPNGPAEEE